MTFPTILAVSLPQVNATLNGLCAVTLLTGFVFIKTGRKKAHIAAMITALLLSVAFLTCYVYHHLTTQLITEFPREYPVARTIYLGILIPHIIMAMVIVPLVLRLVIAALRKNFATHRAVARYTFPAWMFVSVTGVLVYFMLYVWYGPPATRPKRESAVPASAVVPSEEQTLSRKAETTVKASPSIPVSAPLVSGAESGGDAQTGALRFDRIILDIQSDPKDDQVTGVWKVTNVSDHPVLLKEFETSCHCVSVTQGAMTLQPGATTEITAVFDIGNLTGTAEKEVVVMTDDPAAPSRSLTMRVQVPPVFVFEPSLAEWRVGETPAPKTVRLKVAGDTPIKVTEIVSSRPAIKAELEEVESGRDYRIKLTPSSTDDTLLGMVKVVTDATVQKHQKTLFFFQISKP